MCESSDAQLLHSFSTPLLNSNSNHLARHQRSFGSTVGWAASCCGGICWAPDLSVFRTHKETSGEGKEKLLDHLQTTQKKDDGWISVDSWSVNASASKYKKNILTEYRNSTTSISHTLNQQGNKFFLKTWYLHHFLWGQRLFWSSICKFIVNTHIPIVPFLTQTPASLMVDATSLEFIVHTVISFPRS